jgi:hypothetical protein
MTSNVTATPEPADATAGASVLAPPATAATLFNGYIGANVCYALHELGVLRQLEEGPSTVQALTGTTDPARMGMLLRTMEQLGFFEVSDSTVTLTRSGADLVHQQGFFTWSVGGYGSIWSSLAELTDGRSRYGHQVRRDEGKVAVGSSEAGQALMQPIQDSVCASIVFGSMVDIGCGDGSRLIRMCGGSQPRRGLGIDISGPACQLAADNVSQAGLTGQVDIVQANVLDLFGARTFPGVELVMSMLMLHDLFASTADHAGLLHSLRGVFPDARYFLLADTTIRPVGDDGATPIFSLGFELAHAFMGVPLQTRETYEAAFEAADLRMLKRVPFGVPSTWLFLLEFGR